VHHLENENENGGLIITKVLQFSGLTTYKCTLNDWGMIEHAKQPMIG